MAKKRETIIFRCTAKEKETLKKLAGKKTVSGYLRERALREGPMETLRDLIPGTLEGIEKMDLLLRAIEGSGDIELKEKVRGMFPGWEQRGGRRIDAKRDVDQ